MHAKFESNSREVLVAGPERFELLPTEGNYPNKLEYYLI
jgi:hypothetical protein